VRRHTRWGSAVGTSSELRRNFVGTSSELRRNFVGTSSELRRNFVGTGLGGLRGPFRVTFYDQSTTAGNEFLAVF